MDTSTIRDIFLADTAPKPWAEGDNILWCEPGFSKRMLDEHLSQRHGAASRRFEIIDLYVEWIHSKLLKNRPAKILDICCGPGLYLQRLARLGHCCTGIDYSPASIEYAKKVSKENKQKCHYILEDIRNVDFGTDFDLIMMIYGEFNVFEPEQAKQLLSKAHQSLDRNGLLLLEVHTFDAVKRIGLQNSTWKSVNQGLFSQEPHLLLEQGFWDSETNTATKRFYVIDASDCSVRRYAVTYQAYSSELYIQQVCSVGFCKAEFLQGPDSAQKDDFADSLAFLVAEKTI
jgi:SAM-dependent methyltransferase